MYVCNACVFERAQSVSPLQQAFSSERWTRQSSVFFLFLSHLDIIPINFIDKI